MISWDSIASEGGPEPSSAGRIEVALREKRTRGGKALVAFLIFAYPDVDTFEALLFAAEAAGADVVEVGIPVSEPQADGPVIRRASLQALAAGATIASLFEHVAGCRARGLQVPLLLMTYFEPVRAFGTASLCRMAGRAGVDGLLVVDLPPDRAEGFKTPANEFGLETVFLVTPATADSEISAIVDRCTGFVYCASVIGTTGGETPNSIEVARVVEAVRRHTGLPALVGFGIAGPEDACRVASLSDGVIVGTALLRAIGDRRGWEAVDAASGYLRGIRSALDGTSSDMSRAGSRP